jgi:tungstate transport system permease protein
MGEIFQQLAAPSADLWASIGLTVGYASLAVALAFVPALWLAYALVGDGRARWQPLRRVGHALVRGAIAVPGITIGLLLVTLLSRSGPLGFLNGLYHPGALIALQALLAFPLLTALFAQHLRALPPEFTDLALSCGATGRQVRSSLMRQAWPSLISAAVLGWLRVLAETGAAAVAGGNVAGSTRILPTAMALDIQHGDFGRALGLGLLLLFLGTLGAALLPERSRR